MFCQVELNLESLQKMKEKAKITKNTQIIQFFDDLIVQFPDHNLSNFSFSPNEILRLCSDLTNENILSALTEKVRSSFSAYPMTHQVQILDEKLFTLLKFAENKNKILKAFDQIESKRISYFLKLSHSFPEAFKRLLNLQKQKLFECKICLNWVEKELKQNCNQGHEWCAHCLKNWIEASLILNIDQLYRQQSLDFECLHDNCQEILPQEFLLNTKLLDILKLRDDLNKRQNLVNKAEFRQVIGCPERRCVGIAYIYLKGDPNFRENLFTCLVCGNEFSQRQESRDHVPSLILFFSFGVFFAILKNPIIPFLLSLTLLVLYDLFIAQSENLPLECKKCPRCNVVIQKDGGCDHMQCRCGHHFYWSSLEAKRNAYY